MKKIGKILVQLFELIAYLLVCFIKRLHFLIFGVFGLLAMAQFNKYYRNEIRYCRKTGLKKLIGLFIIALYIIGVSVSVAMFYLIYLLVGLKLAIIIHTTLAIVDIFIDITVDNM